MGIKKGDDKQTETQVEEMILNYMRQENRPYSANDIQMNLHISLSKAKLAKILSKIVDDGLFLRKAYNKSMVYCIVQDPDIVILPEDYKIVEDSIDKLKEDQKTILMKNNSLEKVLNKLKNSMKIEEVKSKINELQNKNCLLRERLMVLSEGTRSVPNEKRKRINEEYFLNVELWKKRRMKFREVYGAISENYIGDSAILKSDIGIEEDPISFEDVVNI